MKKRRVKRLGTERKNKANRKKIYRDESKQEVENGEEKNKINAAIQKFTDR